MRREDESYPKRIMTAEITGLQSRGGSPEDEMGGYMIEQDLQSLRSKKEEVDRKEPCG